MYLVFIRIRERRLNVTSVTRSNVHKDTALIAAVQTLKDGQVGELSSLVGLKSFLCQTTIMTVSSVASFTVSLGIIIPDLLL